MRTAREPQWTPRQREVLDLLVRGLTNTQIAERLGISLDGAKWHVREVLTRLGVDSREEAASVWRGERAPLARMRSGLFSFLGVLHGARVALAAVAVIGVGAATAGLLLLRDDSASQQPGASPTESATASPGTTSNLDPRADIPIVDEVVKIARAGDVASFKSLMKPFPEPCTTKARQVGSPPACPPGASEGDLVNTYRASAGERVDAGADMDQFLGTVVGNARTLHGVAIAQPDAFNGFVPPWKYEVFVYGNLGGSQLWAEYFLDDTGVVAVRSPRGGTAVQDRAQAVPSDDWLIAPPSAARIDLMDETYVLGRDAKAHFELQLPIACFRKPYDFQLFGLPDPGAPGGIQVIHEPGLDQPFHVGASVQADIFIPLPDTASSPLFIRPGLRASCLSDTLVGGLVQLALLAPPDQLNLVVIEYSGQALDLGRGAGQGTVGEFISPLSATVHGVLCETIDTADHSLRNARGNVVFVIGTPDQPHECQVPDAPIVFLFPASAGDSLAGKPLFEKPAYMRGAIQLVRNIVPEGIAN
jgi:DNA-binding CsgD family transcriptional regulator